jgi:predicted aspartyl protease
MNEMAFSQAYERRSYDPPMPVLDIGVSRPGASVPAATVEAVVDTGADGTLLPLDVLEQAGAIFVDRAYLRGITGQRQAVDLYLTTIHLGRFRITGVRAAALPPGEAAILGRDVLNQLDIALRGPASVIEVFV